MHLSQGRLFYLFFALKVFHVIDDHQRDLEGEGIIKFSDIKSGALFQLLNPVNQRISVNKELS